MVNEVNPRKFFSKGWDLEMLLGGWIEHYTRGGAAREPNATGISQQGSHGPLGSASGQVYAKHMPRYANKLASPQGFLMGVEGFPLSSFFFFFSPLFDLQRS